MNHNRMFLLIISAILVVLMVDLSARLITNIVTRDVGVVVQTRKEHDAALWAIEKRLSELTTEIHQCRTNRPSQ